MRHPNQAQRHFERPSEFPRFTKDFCRFRDKMSGQASTLLRLKLGIECSSETSEEPPQPVDNWEELSISDRLKKIVVKTLLMPKPTPIQAQALPIGLSGKNLVGIASTGSGKTLAYVLPMLVHTESKHPCKPGEGPHALVLVNSRELATAVCRQLEVFQAAYPVNRLRITSVIGGENYAKQVEQLDGHAEIAVACPGRFGDILQNNQVSISNLTFVVVDEADAQQGDKMMDTILTRIRPDRVLLLFTATYQDCLEECTKKYMANDPPIRVTVGGLGLKACETVRQTFAQCGDRHKSKLDTLVEFLRNPPSVEGRKKCLVFVQTLETVRSLVQSLKDAGISGVQGFDGDQKEDLLSRFHDDENREVQVMVATNTLARGHDFLSLGSVVNYEFYWGGRSSWMVDYVHRIGRTGRAGREGFSLTLLEQDDLRFAQDFVKLVGDRWEIPNWLNIEAKRSGMHWCRYKEKRRQESQRESAATDQSPAAVVVQDPPRLESRMEEYLARTKGRSFALPRFAEVDDHY